MSLRVISGTAKGRKLRDVPGDTTRPVTDHVKEALFNILAGDVVNTAWWDLFGGTGAIGIEALSRGAAFVRFSDLNRAPVETIISNLQTTGFATQCEVRRADAFAMLAAQPERGFDYVYIAPPQYKEMWSKALLALDANPGWLNEDAWVIVQIHPKEYRKLALKNLDEFDERKYGSTLLVFYKMPALKKLDFVMLSAAKHLHDNEETLRFAQSDTHFFQWTHKIIKFSFSS